MKATIFYSWQSDTRAAANRTLIQNALERAAKDIVQDGSIGIEPVIDRDTANVPGAPDIGATILDKIRTSDVVVADVTIINRGAVGRPTPNPNVMLEVGYALATVGERRLVLVVNDAFGPVEHMPFDLRQKRLLVYTCLADSENRAEPRRRLSASLRDAIGTILAREGSRTPAGPLMELSLDFAPLQMDADYHQYALLVQMSNPGTTVIPTPTLEVEIPTDLLDPKHKYVGIVGSRSGRSTTVFRLLPEDDPPDPGVFPGDTRHWNILYRMDDKTFHDKRFELFQRQVKARVYVEGKLAATAERPVIELQMF